MIILLRMERLSVEALAFVNGYGEIDALEYDRELCITLFESQRTVAHSKLLLLTHLVFVLRYGSLMLLTICHIRRAVEPYEVGQRET